jgi:chemotaxis protein CheD
MNPVPASSAQLLLMPGALSFVAAPCKLRTLLGSCVAVVVWHARLRVGGMCHFLLAQHPAGRAAAPLDGRFAPDALAMLLAQMQASGAPSHEFVAHVAGGAKCFDTALPVPALDIGQHNVQAALNWCLAHALPVLSCDVGGKTARHVDFDGSTGQVLVRHTNLETPPVKRLDTQHRVLAFTP